MDIGRFALCYRAFSVVHLIRHTTQCNGMFFNMYLSITTNPLLGRSNGKHRAAIIT
jgi:hypothetical protein